MTTTATSRRELLAQRLDELTTEVDKLNRHEKPTRAQYHRLSELTAEFGDVEHEIRALDIEARQEHVRSNWKSGGYTTENGTSFDGAGDPGISGRPFGEARKVIDGAVRSGQLPDHAAQAATKLVEQGTTRDRSLAARWAVAAGDPAYLRAFGKLLADPERGHMLWSPEEQSAYRIANEVHTELRAMSLTDAAGGFMVPLTLDPAIMLTSAGSINPLRQISRVEQIVSDTWQGVTSAGATAEWKAEAAQAADASPTLAGPAIPVHFGDAFVPYSFEVSMDSAGNFLAELQKVLVDAADQLQATAYTTGSGTGQPTGIITKLIASGTPPLVVGTEAFPSSQVYTVQNSLPPRFSANARWAANLATINTLSQRETTAGARLFPELSDGRLLNKPMHELSNMDGAIDVGAENYILLYGDFRAGFVIVDRIGTSLEFIPNLFGANGRPTGQRGAFLWFRTGSDVVVPQAFRLLNAT
jgi:HK97 family phage major capsid protein